MRFMPRSQLAQRRDLCEEKKQFMFILLLAFQEAERGARDQCDINELLNC